MAFLLGVFGKTAPNNVNNILDVAHKHSHTEGLYTAHIENGVICAGYKKDEEIGHPSDLIYPLENKQGFLVGRIFDNTNYKPIINNEIFATTCVNDPKNLCTGYWGRYAGIFFNKTSQKLQLVRDPQGLFTIFYKITKDFIIFSTELALIYESLEAKPSLDLTFFAEYVIAANNALPTTPFEGINELAPGTALSIDPYGKYEYTLLWDPSHLSGVFIHNEDSFERELLVTLKKCLQAWTINTDAVCVELSGGTDSTGIMLLLHAILPEGKKIIAVNNIDSQTVSTNEIQYAKEVADTCNAEIYYADMSNFSPFDTLPHNWLPNKPSTTWWYYGLKQKIFEIAKSHHCNEIMDGQGGDHIFLAPAPISSLADLYLDQGLQNFRPILNELASMNRTPWLPLIVNTFKEVLGYYKKSRVSEKVDTQFLEEGFAEHLKRHDFFLKDILNKHHPGKAKHIEAIYDAVRFSYGNNSFLSGAITHPLLSQPIIELALKIPTYQSFKDGFDRIFFRRAISRIQKPKALWRRSKGGTTGTVVKSCMAHHKYIMETLLNGKIVQSGIINKKWLDNQLERIEHGQNENLWPILQLLTCQRWIDHWGL